MGACHKQLLQHQGLATLLQPDPFPVPLPERIEMLVGVTDESFPIPIHPFCFGEEVTGQSEEPTR